MHQVPHQVVFGDGQQLEMGFLRYCARVIDSVPSFFAAFFQILFRNPRLRESHTVNFSRGPSIMDHGEFQMGSFCKLVDHVLIREVPEIYLSHLPVSRSIDFPFSFR